MIAGHRDAGRVDLREAGIGEQRAALVGAPDRGGIGVHRVGRQEVGVAVPAGGEQDRVGLEALNRAGHEVARDDAPRASVHDHHVQHLVAREHLHRAGADLPHHRLVGAEQQLLARLAARVERARDLRAAERAIVQQPAVLTRERHALRHALVDDADAHLGQAVDVRLAGPVVAALDRVVEQPRHAVAVVPVVLRGVDPALGRDAVRAARAVLDAEAQDVVARLAQRGRGGSAREAGADDDDGELAAVCRVHELRVELAAIPLLRDRARRDPGIQLPGACRSDARCAVHDRPPMKNR